MLNTMPPYPLTALTSHLVVSVETRSQHMKADYLIESKLLVPSRLAEKYLVNPRARATSMRNEIRLTFEQCC